jgi:hypothetical protein
LCTGTNVELRICANGRRIIRCQKEGNPPQTPQPLLEEIEKYRRDQADIPSRPTAVLQLVQQAINARYEVGDEPTTVPEKEIAAA